MMIKTTMISISVNPLRLISRGERWIGFFIGSFELVSPKLTYPKIIPPKYEWSQHFRRGGDKVQLGMGGNTLREDYGI